MSPSTARHSLNNFVNLKIKLPYSFECAYRDRLSIHVFIWVSNHTCMSDFFILDIFFKKNQEINPSETNFQVLSLSSRAGQFVMTH
jgi:hypothetical protein